MAKLFVRLSARRATRPPKHEQAFAPPVMACRRADNHPYMEPDMRSPRLGESVLYQRGDETIAAIITKVHEDQTVDLVLFAPGPPVNAAASSIGYGFGDTQFRYLGESAA